jgi:xanthine dehydrogenase YagS FAD-binding subunit
METDAWIMAGGLDSFDWLKDRIKRPKVLVDLSGIEELRGIRTTGDGIEIGAMTTLTEIVKHPDLSERNTVFWPKGAELIASPQIRNQGTIGGNVSQDARCWYYRAGWPCYRAGGNICYADTPTGRNREHAILHAERCVAVNPSDSAPALIALDAKFVMRTPRGRTCRRRRGLLHRAGHRHHAPAHTEARRPVDGHSDSVHVGGRAILF